MKAIMGKSTEVEKFMRAYLYTNLLQIALHIWQLALALMSFLKVHSVVEWLQSTKAVILLLQQINKIYEIMLQAITILQVKELYTLNNISVGGLREKSFQILLFRNV